MSRHEATTLQYLSMIIHEDCFVIRVMSNWYMKLLYKRPHLIRHITPTALGETVTNQREELTM